VRFGWPDHGDSSSGEVAEENAYITRERPWRQADLIVNGGDTIPTTPTLPPLCREPAYTRVAVALHRLQPR